ncbi:MAG TPA: GAF domain-containing protein, partial [Chloroflexi bacterium]|nr:GAF domain-containing protein [Chloroflexota bacterium]
PCSLSTVLLGWLAGLIRRRWGLLDIQSATLFALGGEGLHMLLGLLLAGDPARWFAAESIAQSWDLVISRAAIPMILANGVGVGVFFFALHNYLNELRTTQERDDFYSQVERRNAELQAVYQISQDISASLELDQTLQAILTQVRRMIAYDAAEICLYQEQEETLRVRAWIGSEQIAVDTRGQSYHVGEGYTGWIGEHQESLLIPDIETHHAQRPISRQAAEGVPIRAYLGVPLLVGQKLVGTLELVNTQTKAFDEHTRQLLETIAPQAAIAIQNAEHVLERERRLKEQIQHLRIEIDEAKRERQVAEITETEYFRQLQDKAHRFRESRARESKEDTLD